MAGDTGFEPLTFPVAKGHKKARKGNLRIFYIFSHICIFFFISDIVGKSE